MTTKTEAKTEAKTSDLVEVKSPKGHTYTFPSKYGNLPSISARIRAMVADGWTKYQVAKVTGIRYQMVRNIMTQPTPKKS